MSVPIRPFALLLASALLASSASAQRGNQPPRTPPGGRGDTSSLKRTPAGFVLDFQDQQLRTVLSALAEAGALNVSLSNIQDQRVTLRMGQPVTRDGMVDVLRQISEQYSLKMTESGTLIRIEGTPASRVQTPSPLAQALAQQNQTPQVQFYTYRLKHAVAEQIAPVLTSLFTGGSVPVNGRGGQQTIIPNANGGFQVFTPAGPVNAAPAAPAAPGRGGGPPGAGGGGQGNVGRGNQQAQQLGNIQNQIANAFQQAFGGSLSSSAAEIRIIPEAATNSLLIRATAQDYALIAQALSAVDLRPLQVLIEVTIAEVQRTHDLDLGVSGKVTHVPENKNDPTVTVSSASNASARDFIVQLTGGNGSVKYDVALSALQSRGDVRVLSLPVIIAQNNRQAVLNVGSSRPFVQVSQSVPLDPSSRVQTVQYIDVGTVLTITPTINPDGYVNLQVTQTDNSASNEIQFDAPIINKREATTQVFVRDGQTTVIGGLAGKTRDRQQSGIPILSQIPFIGALLFGNMQQTDITTELFLFLTPHIVSSDEDMDRLREAVKDGSDLLKSVPLEARIVPKADTISRVRPDTTRRPPDSLTTLRPRRPPTDSIKPEPPVILSEAKDLPSQLRRSFGGRQSRSFVLRSLPSRSASDEGLLRMTGQSGLRWTTSG